MAACLLGCATGSMSALGQKQTLALIGPWANRAVDSERCLFNRKPTGECLKE
jgi:hypothetical protein